MNSGKTPPLSKWIYSKSGSSPMPKWHVTSLKRCLRQIVFLSTETHSSDEFLLK